MDNRNEGIAMQKRIHVLFLSSVIAGAACAEVFIDDTFDDRLGQAPKNSSLQRAALVEVVEGHGPIGTDPAAHFLDESTSAPGILEYNAGENPLGAFVVSFDLLNNAPADSGDPMALIFSVGQWLKGKGIGLGANASRAFALEFSQCGTAQTLVIRIGKSTAKKGSYDLQALQQVKIWVNDNDKTELQYIRPDTKEAAMLNPDSVVVWINDELVAGQRDSGIAMQSSVSAGDAALGRAGFCSSTTAKVDFLIDNFRIESVSP